MAEHAPVPRLPGDFPANVLGAAGSVELLRCVLAHDPSEDGEGESDEDGDEHEEEDCGEGEGLGAAVEPVNRVDARPHDETGCCNLYLYD